MMKSLDKLAAFGELVENARIARTPPNNGTIGVSAHDLQILDWAFTTLVKAVRGARIHKRLEKIYKEYQQ